MGGYEVDPHQLAGSGKTVGAQGDALIAALNTLDSALAGSGLMCGTDAAGLQFFSEYSKSGQAVISAAESAVNAFRNVGYGVEVSAHNYAVSDAASTVGGGRESIPVPAEPTKYTASGVGGQSGPEIPEPSLWSLVQPFVSRAWPNGNPETMRAVAGAWRAFGSAISTAAGDAGDCLSSVSGHDIPELTHITEALNTLTGGTSALAGKCSSLAEKLDSFADEVQSAQDAIRDLLHRLSASGIVSQIGRIFTGHNPIDDLKQIGHDISEILHTLSGELDTAASGFQMLIDGMDGLVREFEEWDRKEFTRFFGNDVGNALANHVNAFADIEEGVAKSGLEVAQSVPTMLAHPVETAKGVWEIDKNLAEFFNPLGPMLDPKGQKEAGEHLLETVKGVVDYKDWSSDRPLVGLGDNLGNIAQVLIPGVGEAKAGVTAGKVGEEGAQLARAEGAAARSGVEAFGKTGVDEIAGQAGKIGKDLDSLSVSPVEAPKGPEPVARPADSGPVPGANPAGDGAAAGDAGAGKAPVDAGVRPSGETAPTTHGPGAGAHDGEGAAGAHHGFGNATRTTPPEYAWTNEANPGGVGPHEAALPHETGETHSGYGDHGGGSHGGGGDQGGGSHGGPPDGVRTYSLMDGSSHSTGFAPEQLSDVQRIDGALADHGVRKSDFVDLINTPTDSLTPAQRDLVNDVRDYLPHPTDDTVMQKVIPPGHFDEDGIFARGRADDYIMGNDPRVAVDQVGGAVTVADDTSHLSAPAKIYDGLRLDYTDSPFERHDPGTHVIRFQADPDSPGSYEVPRNSDMGGTGAYDGWGEPFTGNGFTKAGDDVIPEYIGKNVTMRDGAEMWEVLDDGTQRLVAVLKNGEWVPQGN
ncbi:hypothetical protein VST63_23165 [Mycolicibacterium sp. 050232]|uniref:WXG100-like domain-containing protein n=1 Tax=Mycolicibacterium sp. 050232 TaxID=3113982 RepID=UPI002E29979B|nr:hypothetical protein [Mycolicibacterium sp. 050232]MED5815271.1 hypothetical protein [Mycolicibacterium sp. 050232]